MGLSWHNCFWLLIPPLAWNMVFTQHLPTVFERGEVPSWLLITENILRMGVMLLPLLLPISSNPAIRKLGLLIYASGLLLYFGSWIYLILYPSTDSILLLLAPAYTPLIWLWGIVILAQAPWYGGLALLFIGFHIGEYLIRFQT